MHTTETLREFLTSLEINATDDQILLVVEKVEMKRRKNRAFKKGVAADKHRLTGSKYLARYGFGKRSSALRKTLMVNKKFRKQTIKNDISDYLSSLGVQLTEEQKTVVNTLAANDVHLKNYGHEFQEETLSELDQTTYSNAATARISQSNAQLKARNKKGAKKSLTKGAKLILHGLGREKRVQNTPKTKPGGLKIVPKMPRAGSVAKRLALGAKGLLYKFVARGKIDESVLQELYKTTYASAAGRRRILARAHGQLGNTKAAETSQRRADKIEKHAMGRDKRVENTPTTKLQELDQTTYANAAKRRYAMGVAHQELGNRDASQANQIQSRKIEAHAMGKGERVKRTSNIRFLGKRNKPEAKFQTKPTAPVSAPTEDPKPIVPTSAAVKGAKATPKPKAVKKLPESFINEAIKRIRDKKNTSTNPDVRLTPMVHGIQAGMSMKAEEFTTEEE